MKNQETINNTLAEERTLLAAERTFSAWLRTALAAMAGGLAIMRLVIFKSEFHEFIARIIGELLILWGFIIIILAMKDYKKIRNKLLITKNYKSSQIRFLITAIPLIIISILLIWVSFPNF